VTAAGQVRWGIVGTANIARAAFLPALRAAGGVAAAVAGRDLARAEQYASAHGVGRAVQGYQALIEDPAVDALYIALPNSLHAEWTIRALEAGRPVLCEKPLSGVLADTERVLSAARRPAHLAVRAFVFPFGEQMTRIRSLVDDGAIGEIRESSRTFTSGSAAPTTSGCRLTCQGGALRDVGCYPVRLAQAFFGEHSSAQAAREPGGQGVDTSDLGHAGVR
jgi:predicted dehydrogenase